MGGGRTYACGVDVCRCVEMVVGVYSYRGDKMCMYCSSFDLCL